MKELKGTKTEKNLMEAFAGESQARNKYTYFASKAKKEGYVQIAAIFEETANQEKEHAKLWFKYLEGGAVKSTIENLEAAAAGENFEWTDMYKHMAEDARAEGFDEIAERIYQFDEVEAVYLMSGGFDLTVMLRGSSLKSVAEFVSGKLAPMESVLSTATHFVLKKYKEHGIPLVTRQEDERMLITP